MRSVSAIKENHAFLVWTVLTGFCLVFSMIYEYFSFGVWSNYMGFLALIPLFLGVFPSLFAGGSAGRFWNDGVLCLIAGSALQGILEIYGTDSPYPVWFLLAGLAFFLLGVLGKLFRKLQKK